MRGLLNIFLLALSGCAATPDVELNSPKSELHNQVVSDAPYWNLVSLDGFDDALRKAYDTKTYQFFDSSIPIEFDEMDYDEFSKYSGKVRIYSVDYNAQNDSNLMKISFSSCNGIGASYRHDGQHWRHISSGQTLISCERLALETSGKPVLLWTPMLLDNWFRKLAPDITGYDVSTDDQTLTLHDVDGKALGVFKKDDAE